MFTHYQEGWYWPITTRLPQWDTAAEASILSPRTRSHRRLPVIRSKAWILWEWEPMNAVVLPSSDLWSVLYCTRSTGEASTHRPVSEDQLRLRLRASPPRFLLESFALSASPREFVFVSGFLIFMSITTPARRITLTAHVSSAAVDCLRSLFAGTAEGASAWCFLASGSDGGLFSSGSISVALATWRSTSEKVPSSITSKSSGEVAPTAVRMSSQRCSAFRESPPLNRKLDPSSMIRSLGRPRVSCRLVVDW